MTSMRYLGCELTVEYVGSYETMAGYWVAGV